MKRMMRRLFSMVLALTIVAGLLPWTGTLTQAADTEVYKSKVISILGDSISTYAGYIPGSDGFNAAHKSRYPLGDVTKVEHTWWDIVLNHFDAKLGVNDSWRGTSIYNTETAEVNGNYGGKATLSSPTRVQNLGSNGTPDVILFFAGTNDVRRNNALGTFNASTAPTAENVDLTNTIFDNVVDGYQTTIARMQHYYPNAQIVAILPGPNDETDLADVYANRVKTYNTQFKKICNHYGVPYVDLSTLDVELHTDGIHPTAAGMKVIANAVTTKLESITTNLTSGKHTVYKISHDLTGAKASKSHYTGVDSNVPFEETITLTDKNAQITVFMNGLPVENAYADGKVTIGEVTGPLYITDSIDVDSGGVFVDKFATVNGIDGTYTFDLSGFVTGQTTQTQYSTAAPLDIILVLDASSSMAQFPNPASGYHTAMAEIWKVARGYPASGVEATDNLWMKFRRSTHYFNADGMLEAGSAVAGSILIPVKGGDHIYCSSFAAKSATGGNANGIRVTFFDEDGNMITSWSPSNVYSRFEDSGGKYITVPDGAYAMNVPLWKNDSTKEIKNLSLSKDNPSSGYAAAQAVNWGGTYSVDQEGEPWSAKTNLWDKVPYSRKYYNNLFELVEDSTVAGSITIPVKPGDHIYASSFKAAATTGGPRDGIRITYFDENGAAVQTMSPASVYAEFSANNYIVIPDGVYGVNIPLWKTDTEAVIRNLSLSEKNSPKNYDPVYAHGWEAEYPASTKKATNLWNVFEHKSKYYNADGVLATNDYIKGSILIPVKPGDHIYASSFKDKATTGGNNNGIRVAYFNENGNLVSSVGYADVYEQFQKTDYEYIVVPEGVYAMSIPLWANDSEAVIKNLSLEYRYNPNTEEEFNSMRAKLLQEQLQKFADALAENAATTGQEHKLAIVTFGGGNESIAMSDQGMFYEHNGVNGFSGTYFANTGIFVGGQFKNFVSTSLQVDKGGAYNYYVPVYRDGWNGTAALDQTKTYYYLQTGLYTENYKNYGGYAWREVKYDTTQKRWEDAETGEVVKARVSPYDEDGRTQFYTRTDHMKATTLKAADYKNALTSVLVNNTLNSDLQFAIDRYMARGSTHTKWGLRMAYNILNQNPVRTSVDELNVEHQGQQIVILFTDGETDDPEKVDTNGDGVADTNTYGTIFDYSTQIKELGAKLYTVSVGKDANKRWMDQISSNCPDQATYDPTLARTNGEYYINIANMTELDMAFSSITNDLQISRTDVELDGSAVMQDFLGEDFEIPEDFGFANISVGTVGMTTADDATYTEVQNSEVVYTYDSAANDGTYTNGTDKLKVSFDRKSKRITVTGFNYEDNYVAQGHDGKKLVVKIRGVELATSVNTDGLVDTNDANSGIAYTKANGETGIYAFGFPKTQVNSAVYIVDYGKSMTLSPADWNSTLAGIDAGETLNTTHTAGGVLTTDYGVFTMNSGKLVFTPTNTNWDAPAVVFALGQNSALPAGVTTGAHMWTKIIILPANNIYYEDDIDSIDYSGKDTATGADSWVQEGTDQGNVEHHEGDTPFENGIHGWEGGLKDKTYSNGTAHTVTVSDSVTAQASFTFTGEGVDIYGRTNGTTGTVLVTIRGTILHESGEYPNVSQTLIVDTHAGSGDYHQIPAVSFMDLPYDTYTVTLYVTVAAGERCTYYLDGVRVYKPLSDDSAYAEAEQNASFMEIRDLLAKPDDAGKSGGTVFIDLAEDGKPAAKDYDATEYGTYGPKNEIYLQKGQSIVFKVSPDSGYYYVGLKCPDIGAGENMVLMSDGATNQQIGITHSTDLYYAVQPDVNGYITIQNNGDSLLSVTKLRTAGAAEAAQVMMISNDEAVYAFRAFSLRRLTGEESGPVDPDNPATSDVALMGLVWVALGAVCMLVIFVASHKRRCGYEA